MRRIPTKLRAEMEADPYYHRCCVTGVRRGYGVKIDFHHNLIYAGRQVNEKWCILPLLRSVHDQANSKTMRDKLDWIMLNRTDEATLRAYSKAKDLVRRRDQLNEEFGVYKVKL